MTKSTLIVLFRKFRKGDIYSIINLAGLSIGIAACIMIFFYVTDELRYDRHIPQAEETYRLLLNNPSRNSVVSILPAVMADHLKDRLPGVEKMGRLQILRNELVMSGSQGPMVETHMAFADESILELFSLTFIEGNPATALSEPHSLILTTGAAEKYFGEKNPMGETLVFENMFSFVVTGIIEPMPSQSHICFSMLASVESFRQISPGLLTLWGNQSQMFYFRLSPGSDPNAVSEQITSIIWDVNKHFKDQVYFELQPLTSIRLRSGHVDWDAASTGDIMVVRIFSLIAILVLFLACFNYINLAVAMSVNRSREIGIKKALGASRRHLIGQFLSETFLMGTLAMMIALLIVEINLPLLNVLTGKELNISFLTDPFLILFSFLLLIIVSLMAGGYPALVITRFRPVSAIKGTGLAEGVKINGKSVAYRFRQLLMVLQFAVSAVLIVVSCVIIFQSRYMSGRHPGYHRENLLVIRNPMDENMKSRAHWLKNQLLQSSHVQSVALSHNIPPVSPHIYSTFQVETEEGNLQVHGALISTDADFFPTLGSQIIRGRNFSGELATDASHSVIINQTMQSRIGEPDPIGRVIRGFNDNNPRQIIGVVEDIHYSSLHELPGPMAFYVSETNYPQNYFNMLVRFQEGSQRQVVNLLEQLWTNEASIWPLQYQFIEKQVSLQYENDHQTMLIVVSFTALAVVLSIMGLLGMALYTTSGRSREIGIRKVLGASIASIVRMITKDFAWLVIISNIIAWPVAWHFSNRWLNNFAYTIDFHWLMFTGPSLLILILASLAVGIVSLKAASQDPASTLKDDN